MPLKMNRNDYNPDPPRMTIRLTLLPLKHGRHLGRRRKPTRLNTRRNNLRPDNDTRLSSSNQ